MRKLIIFVLSLFLIGCVTGTSNLVKRIDDLEAQLEKARIMGMAGESAANFYPARGGLDSTAAAGECQDITTVATDDACFFVGEDYTGTANEGPWNGIAMGNLWGIWVLDADGGSGESWPEYGVSGDGGSERWEYAGYYQVKTEFLPIAWAIDGASAPEAIETITSTNSVKVRKFDDAADEDVQINWAIPSDFLTGYTGIKFRVIAMVTESTAPSSTGWAFFLQGASIGSDDGLASALGTAVESNVGDVSYAQYDIAYSSWSSVVTITNLTAGEYALLKLYRDVSDGDDDYTQDVGVIGIEIRYPAQASGTW